MPPAQRYLLDPGIDKRRFKQIHDQVSVQSFYAFELVFAHRGGAPFSFEQIEKMSQDAKRFHTGRLLEYCLSELVEARALVVENEDGP